MRYAVLLVAVGCSSDLSRVKDPSAAEDSVVQLETAANAMAASDGSGALAAVLATLTDGTAISGYPSGTQPPSYAVVTATCMPASCTFDATTSMSMFGPDYRLTGTLAADGDAITLSLTGGFVESMVERYIHHSSIDGSITLTPTQLDGSVTLRYLTGVAGLPDQNAELDYTIAYHAVRLDAQGCPIGGSLTATTTGRTIDANIAPAMNVNATIDVEQEGSFGPCGTVH